MCINKKQRTQGDAYVNTATSVQKDFTSLSYFLAEAHLGGLGYV